MVFSGHKQIFEARKGHLMMFERHFFVGGPASSAKIADEPLQRLPVEPVLPHARRIEK